MSRGRICFLVALAVAGACGPSARDGGDATVHDSSGEAGGGGNFADPCSRHADCAGGYCVEPAGGIGGQCTRTCSADCPTGWDCLPVEFPESNVDLCVPATGRLCAPCANDGGKGGNGSGGAGGCGGSSYGVFTSGVGTPNYCQAGAANTFVGGIRGGGGPGGFSAINTGGSGAMGLLLDCSFN